MRPFIVLPGKLVKSRKRDDKILPIISSVVHFRRLLGDIYSPKWESTNDVPIASWVGLILC